MTPANAASPAPRLNTSVNSSETRMPTTRAIAGSSPPADQRDRDIGAEHEERAVRQIGDAHQPENQREAGRQQKQQPAHRDAADGEQQPQTHQTASRSGGACSLERDARNEKHSPFVMRGSSPRVTTGEAAPFDRMLLYSSRFLAGG